MEAGFKNEENAILIVHEEIAVMKEEINNIKTGSSRDVSSAASTRIGPGTGMHVWPPPLETRWSKTWVPRKLEFKGWHPDCSLRNFQGTPHNK